MIEAHVQLCAAAGSGGDKLRTPTWIEIVLIGEDNKPIPEEEYALLLPGGTIRSGMLDDQGSVKILDLPPGVCQVSFPNLDKDAWTRVETQSQSADTSTSAQPQGQAA
jgi:hypothetical protein